VYALCTLNFLKNATNVQCTYFATTTAVAVAVATVLLPFLSAEYIADWVQLQQEHVVVATNESGACRRRRVHQRHYEAVCRVLLHKVS